MHTSAMPELWNMEKCLAVAIAQAVVAVSATVLFLVRPLGSQPKLELNVASTI